MYGIMVPMYIESVPNRNSPPAILLRESYREAGKVRKRTLANLSQWPSKIVGPLLVRDASPHDIWGDLPYTEGTVVIFQSV